VGGALCSTQTVNINTLFFCANSSPYFCLVTVTPLIADRVCKVWHFFILVALVIDSVRLVSSSSCLNHYFCFVFFDPQTDNLTELRGSLRRLGLIYINELIAQSNINSFVCLLIEHYFIWIMVIIQIEICKFVIFCIKYIVWLYIYLLNTIAFIPFF